MKSSYRRISSNSLSSNWASVGAGRGTERDWRGWAPPLGRETPVEERVFARLCISGGTTASRDTMSVPYHLDVQQKLTFDGCFAGISISAGDLLDARRFIWLHLDSGNNRESFRLCIHTGWNPHTPFNLYKEKYWAIASPATLHDAGNESTTFELKDWFPTRILIAPPRYYRNPNYLGNTLLFMLYFTINERYQIQHCLFCNRISRFTSIWMHRSSSSWAMTSKEQMSSQVDAKEDNHGGSIRPNK